MKRIGARIFLLFGFTAALAGCKTQLPSTAIGGDGQPSGHVGESEPAPAPRPPGLGNGEAYNGPILSGPSLPSKPRPNPYNVPEIEKAVLSCHGHFVRRILEDLFEGPVVVQFAGSWQHASTRALSTDARAFYTQTEGHWRIRNQDAQEFEVTWSALGGKLVPRRQPPETPFFNLEIRSPHAPSAMLEIKTPSALPLLAFAISEPDDILSPHNFKGDRLNADVSHVWFQNTALKTYTRDNAGLPLGELAQCLQFTLAEGRETQGSSLEKWEAQNRFVKNAFQRFKLTGEPSLIRLLELSAPENHPLHIIFWERPERAGVHRSTHHVGLNPRFMGEGDSLFYLVHELAHRAQPNLDAIERKFKTLYYRTMRIGLALKKKPAPLTEPIHRTLTEYVDAGLELQLLNEWRVWTIAFDIYLKVKLKNPSLESLAPWKEIAWVEKILAEKRPGESLKQFTFRFLDANFSDPADPERPYLDVVLRERRKKLREEMARTERTLGDLEFIYRSN